MVLMKLMGGGDILLTDPPACYIIQCFLAVCASFCVILFYFLMGPEVFLLIALFIIIQGAAS
jgi:hypothetical protein